MKRFILILLALLLALTFMACPPEDQDGGDGGDGGASGESFFYDFEDMTEDSAPNSPWVAVADSTGTGNGPVVRENANTEHNALMVSEFALGTGYNDWGTDYTGHSYVQIPANAGENGGTLTFNYCHFGWDSGEAGAPNYGAFEFWIDAPSDLSNPGSPDWSESAQVSAGAEGEDFAGSAVINIPAGTHTFTWRKEKTNTSNDEDSAWIDNVSFTASVGGGDDDPGNGKWLIMMYMDGDCNLEPQLWEDINEMEYGLGQMSSSTRDKVTIVALWDGNPSYSSGGPDSSKLYELGTDSSIDTSLDSSTTDLTSSGWFSSEVNMGDGNTLTEFLDWANSNYTGYDNKMLVFSNHGGGARGIGGNGRGGTRAVCWDDSAGGDFLETKEVADAIDSSNIGMLSIVGMDACLMATVEEAYELRDSAKYFVASLETEQGDGWEYNHWLPQMSDSTGPRTLSTILVQSYKTNFDSLYGNDQTLSAADLALMEDLKTAVDNLASAINSSGDSSSIKTVFQNSQRFYGAYATQVELGEFCENLVAQGYVTTEANMVLNTLANTIVYSWADSSSGNYYGAGTSTKKGLAIVGDITAGTNFYDTSYLDFATSPGWKDVIDDWY